MPWPTFSDVKSALADALKMPVGTLPSLWDGIVSRAMGEAKSDIYDALGSKGYDDDQIDAWQDLDSYALRQSLYHCLIHGTGLVAFDQFYINAFDQRKRMDDKAFLRIGGKAVAATTGGSEVGGIVTGRTAAGIAMDAAFRCRPEIPW